MRGPLLGAWVVSLVLSFGVASAAAPGEDAYLTGLDALENARWKDAVAAFAKAVDADDENATYYQARGVARTLAEQFPQAIDDPKRARKLNEDAETKLWQATAMRMGGDVQGASQLFGFGRLPNDYVDLVYNVVGMDYWQSKTNGRYYDRETRKQVPVSAPVTKDFPQAAGMFVARHKAAGAPGGVATLERVKALIDRRDFAAAMKDVRALRAGGSNAPQLVGYFAVCSLELGDAATARGEFTRLLTGAPLQPNWYEGRALAAATLGDRRRAEADLAILERLSPDSARKQRPEVERRLRRVGEAGDPVALQAELRQAAEAGEPPDRLVERAVALCRAVGARRLRSDESYTERLYELESKLAAAPQDADRLAALAGFLWDESTVRGERVSPRAPVLGYRHSNPDAERTRARMLANEALALNPDHPSALATIAHVYLDAYTFGDAGKAIDRLRAVAPEYPELAMLDAQLLESLAAIKAARAADLRQVHQWSDALYIYTRWPSEAELARAEALQREAEAMSERALAEIDAAARRWQGKPLGFYYEASAHRARNELPEAVEALKKMVELEPRSTLGWSQLAGVYDQMGKPADAAEARVTATNLVQTTATPLLEQVWDQIVQTRWRTSRQMLERCAAVDPANPRVAAYRAIASPATDKPEEAAAWYRIALAVDEANARLHGTTRGGGGPPLDSPDDIGLSAALRLRLADLLTKAGKNAEAAQYLARNAALESRIAPALRVTAVYSALLPDQQTEATTLPQADTAASMLAWSCVRLGDLCLAARDYTAADKQYQAARRFEAQWPMTASGRETMYQPASFARLGLAKCYLALGRPEDAQHIMMNEGFPGGGGDELKADIQRVQEQIRKGMEARAEAEERREAAITPAQRQAQAIQEMKDFLLKQKAEYEQDLRRPDITEQERQIDQRLIADLDRRLAAIDRPKSQPPQPTRPRRQQ